MMWIKGKDLNEEQLRQVFKYLYARYLAKNMDDLLCALESKINN